MAITSANRARSVVEAPSRSGREGADWQSAVRSRIRRAKTHALESIEAAELNVTAWLRVYKSACPRGALGMLTPSMDHRNSLNSVIGVQPADGPKASQLE